jgi:hypothetical protein
MYGTNFLQFMKVQSNTHSANRPSLHTYWAFIVFLYSFFDAYKIETHVAAWYEFGNIAAGGLQTNFTAFIPLFLEKVVWTNCINHLSFNMLVTLEMKSTEKELPLGPC